MVMPPIKDPTELLPTFCKGFRNIFDTIQNICKPNPIWIGPWDPKQASNHIPIIKTKKDIPDGKFPMHRQKLSAYLGGYFDPNPKGETMYSKIRFITPSESSLDLALLGLHLRGAFYYMEPEWQVAIPQNPIPCQAIRSTCIGWLFGSTKFINEKSFLPAVKKALDLPPECHIGMQWRVINTPTGKRPPYDTTKSSPCAIHIDVDDLYAPIVATRASELWCSKTNRSKHQKRLPNDIQLRLIPCFSNLLTRTRSAESKADILQMAEKQQYLVETVLQRIEVPFIRLLDTELSKKDSITLRRVIMAQPPINNPTKRLIHNVDFNWNESKVVITTPIQHIIEASNFAHNMIPALRYTYGDGINKWFTAAGIQLFKDHLWDPESARCISKPDTATRSILQEDLWDIGDSWKTKKDEPTRPQLPPAQTSDLETGTTVGDSKPTNSEFADDTDIRSFASAFQRSTDSRSEPPPLSPTTKTGGIVQLSEDTLTELELRPPPQDTDTLSMSTAAKTTESTRLKLQMTKEHLAETHEVLDNTRAILAERDNEIDQLRRRMAEVLQQQESMIFTEPPPREPTEDDHLSQTSAEVIQILTQPPRTIAQPSPIPYAPYPPIRTVIQPPRTLTAIDLTQPRRHSTQNSSLESESEGSSTASYSSPMSASSNSPAHNRYVTKERVDPIIDRVDHRD